MPANELTIGYQSGYQLTARVDTRDGEDQLLIGWRDPKGKRPSQELWLSLKESPSVLRTLAGFADGHQQ